MEVERKRISEQGAHARFMALPESQRRVLGAYFEFQRLVSIRNFGEKKLQFARELVNVGQRILWHIFEFNHLPEIGAEKEKELIGSLDYFRREEVRP